MQLDITKNTLNDRGIYCSVEMNYFPKKCKGIQTLRTTHTTLKCLISHTDLVADGFGAAPVQQKLLNATGAGRIEALRSSQFRSRLHVVIS